jgi:hypothetical protein
MNRRFTITLATAFVGTFGGTWALLDGHRFYPDCGWARTFGAAPIARGAPGYRSALDADSDGIACEPFSDDIDQSSVRRFRHL